MTHDFRNSFLLALLGFTLTAVPLLANAKTTTAARTASYSGKTKLGVLMDDPAATAVLHKHLPEFMADKNILKGRSYSPRFLAGLHKGLKAALPAIERDLASVPVQIPLP